MDTQRLILFIIFSFSLLMLWEAWQKETRPPVPAQQQQQAKDADIPAPATAPAKPASPAATAATPATAAVPGVAAATAARELIRVSTDFLKAEIDPLGGDIVRVELLRYTDSLDPKKKLVLLGPEHRYVAQSGLIGNGLPNHRTLFTPRAREYQLADGQDAVEVKLEATTPEGVRVVKTLTFRRSSYVVDIAQEITNGTAAPLVTQAYFHLTRDGKAPADAKSMLLDLHRPGHVHRGQRNSRRSRSRTSTRARRTTRRSARRRLDRDGAALLCLRVAIGDGGARLRGQQTGRQPVCAGDDGQARDAGARCHAEPRRYAVRRAAGRKETRGDGARARAGQGLRLASPIIAAPLYWLLDQLHKVLGNWGWSIVALVVLLKIAFYWLNARAYRRWPR